jgi:hypothetical protein
MSSSPSQATRWFDLFAAFGRAPGPDTHAAVFHPDGEVSDAGMATPTPASQVGDAIAHVLRLMPDLTIDMRRYRSRGAAVFVEAANRGTINGTPVAWGATYRVHLRDGGVHQGRRFSDQTALFRALRPDMAWLPQMPASPHIVSAYQRLIRIRRHHRGAGSAPSTCTRRGLCPSGLRAVPGDRLGGRRQADVRGMVAWRSVGHRSVRTRRGPDRVDASLLRHARPAGRARPVDNGVARRAALEHGGSLTSAPSSRAWASC